ncbi:ATP-binding protein, partial [Gammaproteobacteria bacterium]|nr:ATP-binding protein [Gammaproteobacteria bacterium]
NEVVAQRSSVHPVPSLGSVNNSVAVLVDPDRLAAVIGHIVQNAQEATPHDGSVKITLHTEGAWSVVEVTDTGCGMDEEFIQTRLFRPFDTTKGNAGMGVGAYETREFALTHGGEIDVVSESGKGTTFRIKLPRHPGAAGQVTPLRAVQ